MVHPRRARALAALGAALVVACGGDGDLPLGATARAERAAIERLVVATGTIEPEREVEVRPRIPGIVQKLHVAAGDRVEPGAPLVEIERELLEAQVREARAALQTAGVEERYAQIALARAQKLQAQGAASDRALDDARSRHETARAAVARARAALESLEVQLSYTHITAPAAGRVLDVYVEEGDAVAGVAAVSGGTLLLSLAGGGSQHLQGLVDENEVARVALAQEARIRTEAYPGRVFAGRVREIAPVGKREQNVTYFEVEVEVVDPEGGLLKPRMSADADIVTELVPDALVVPATALRYEGEKTYVETVVRESDPRVVRADVKIGIVDGARVQVLEGLAEGTEVLLK
jgi:RND family efflux transporter MFP subunit